MVDGAQSLIVELNDVKQSGFGIKVTCSAVGQATDAITVKNNFLTSNAKSAIAIGGAMQSTKAVKSAIVGISFMFFISISLIN